YVLPGETLFGHMRGAYTEEELRDIDAYAAKLGIEMIGCIQTLGHMEQVLKWPSYKETKDTGSVLLCGSEKTYELIERMVSHFKKVFRSNRIHIGMDEAWDLGRGNFLDINGYQRNFDIFNNHLKKVVEIVNKHELQPMIWSDMYFRMGSESNNYYDENCNIPDEISKDIPEEVSFVYWDYYHEEKDFYSEWIRRHKELGKMPVMASGVWTWAGPWYWHLKTTKTALPCIESCEKSGVRELIFTMWGDDGGYCDFDSATAGLAMTAERAFNSSINESVLKKRFNRLFNSDFDTITLASEMNNGLNPAAIIWDDPILGLYLDTIDNDSLEQAIETFTELNGKLADRDIPDGAGSISHAFFLTRSILEKITLQQAMLEAYRNKDKEKLKELAAHIFQMEEHMAELEESFRRQWMKRNKPFGFESLQIRLSGCKIRLHETARRINEYIDGKNNAIPELDERLSKDISKIRGKRYYQLATASSIL
ncbi:MAG: family 20 glycosylhydrolase, partial [Verrucomicrobiota bacterium]